MTREIDWEDAFSNGDYIENAADFPPMWSEQAARFRASVRGRLDLPYGDAPREKLDLFLPDKTPKGLIVFVHGGYWQAFDKSSWSHLARGGLAAGWAVALPGYDLCPDVRIADITRQIAKAVAIDEPVSTSSVKLWVGPTIPCRAAIPQCRGPTVPAAAWV